MPLPFSLCVSKNPTSWSLYALLIPLMAGGEQTLCRRERAFSRTRALSLPPPLLCLCVCGGGASFVSESCVRVKQMYAPAIEILELLVDKSGVSAQAAHRALQRGPGYTSGHAGHSAQL